ncbi:MFS transporter [Actinomadura sp. ATCC 31491]|uniref:MFS transporter n=1 Tax=Actinomadura luzonensis TaxID=2805427 RepID=A0ABT0FIW0_9ACTN|nr:MFS transporter [Actinomadura luzonensis]MCK2212234.1 MFS transporter [Actinomadura luzonensis]
MTEVKGTGGTGGPAARALLAARRPFPALLAAVLLLGVAESMAGPYLVLFGARRAHLTAFQIGVFVSATAVSGMLVSHWLGRRYDRAPSRWPAVAAAAVAGAGYLLLTGVRAYWLLLVVAVLFLGAQQAAFPQLFAMHRGHVEGGSAMPGGGTPLLRSAWSLAWAAGPVAGGALMAWRGFDALLPATALGLALTTLAVLLLPAPPRPAPTSDPTSGAPSAPVAAGGTTGRSGLWAAVGAFMVFHTAMFAGSVALPLYVTEDLGRPAGDVGLMFSVCALVEIPAALALLLLPARRRHGWVILAGMALFAGYFALAAAATTVLALVLAQVARGVAIAVVGALGITYVQDALPGAAGRATTLFANAVTAGSLVSGVAAGTVAQALGYRWALAGCAVLAALACALFALAERRGASSPG